MTALIIAASIVYGFGAGAVLLCLMSGVPGTGSVWRCCLAAVLWPFLPVYYLGAVAAYRLGWWA